MDGLDLGILLGSWSPPSAIVATLVATSPTPIEAPLRTTASAAAGVAASLEELTTAEEAEEAWIESAVDTAFAHILPTRWIALNTLKMLEFELTANCTSARDAMEMAWLDEKLLDAVFG